MSETRKVVAVFCLAGLVSGWAFSSYSAWVGSLYGANSARHLQGMNSMAPGYDPGAAQKEWYAENLRLTAYADRQWPIFCLGFSAAMTVAMLIAFMAEWLPREAAQRMFPALIPIYIAPVLLLFFTAVSWFLLLLPALALAAYLLTVSARILMSRPPRKLFRNFLISGAACFVLYFAMLAIAGEKGSTASGVFIIAMEVTWAGLYGKALAESAALGREATTP